MFFCNSLAFFDDPADVGNLVSGSSAFSKSSLHIWNFMVHILLKPGWENFEDYFTSVWNECNCAVVWAFFGIAFLCDWNENWQMTRENIDILGISELRWTGVGEFNPDDRYMYYCGQESLRKKWSSHHSQPKSPNCSTWMRSQKRQNDLCWFPRQTIQYHGNPSLCHDL